MRFKVKQTKLFSKQIDELTEKERKLVSDKIDLAKQNPFRFKKLVGYKSTFEIKITINRGFSRLIYCVFSKDEITIMGIFKRKKDFKDFARYYKRYLLNKGN